MHVCPRDEFILGPYQLPTEKAPTNTWLCALPPLNKLLQHVSGKLDWYVLGHSAFP
jgi:hypothetical protein